MANGLPELQGFDLSQIDARATQARAADVNMQLHRMQMAEAQRQQDQEAQLAQMFKDPNLNMRDSYGVMKKAMAISPRSGIAVGTGLANMAQHSEMTQARTDARQKQKQEFGARLLMGVVSAPKEQQAAAYQQALGVYESYFQEDAGRFPRQWDENTANWASSIVAGGMSPEQQMAVRTPKVENIQVGDRNIPTHVYPGGAMAPIQVPGAGIAGGPKFAPDKPSDALKVVEDATSPTGYSYQDLKGNKIPGAPGPQQGMTTTLPDGTTVSVGGTGKAGSSSATGLPPATQNKINDALLSASSGLAATLDLQRKFEPELATIPAQFTGKWNEWKNKAGFELGAEDKEALEKLVLYRQTAAREFSNSLKELSGVAVNPQEYKRAEAFLINPGTGIFDGDPPDVVKSKMKGAIEFQQRAIARLNYIRKNGMSIQNVPLDSMDGIIGQRAKEILTALESKAGLSVEQKSQIVKQQLAAEFGVVY